MLPATFIAQPTGNADVPIVVEIVVHLFARAREAMHNRRADASFEVAHDRHEVFVRIALVQEQRLADIDRRLQLHLKRTALCRTR